MGIITVLWEKGIEFRRDFIKITLGAVLTPLMYLIAFGFGLRPVYEGKAYILYLIPGLVCMTVMTSSFSAVLQNMSVQRLYEKALDQVLMSPTPLWQFLLGQITGGMLRGLYGGFMILLITYPLKTELIFSGMSLLLLCLDGLVFAAFALALSFLATSYADAPRFNSYIIMPMTFLCNTFFSSEALPEPFGSVIKNLPLSLACAGVRRVAGGSPDVWREAALLGVYLIILLLVSFHFVYNKKNL